MLKVKNDWTHTSKQEPYWAMVPMLRHHYYLYYLLLLPPSPQSLLLLFVVIRHFNKCTKLNYHSEVASRLFSNEYSELNDLPRLQLGDART